MRDLYVIEKNGKFGVTNKKGDEVISCIYDYIEPIWRGFARAKLNGECGYVSHNVFIPQKLNIIFRGYFTDVKELLEKNNLEYSLDRKEVYVGDSSIIETPIGYVMEITGCNDDESSDLTWKWVDVETGEIEIIERYLC